MHTGRACYHDSTQCWKDKTWTSTVSFGNVQLEEKSQLYLQSYFLIISSGIALTNSLWIQQNHACSILHRVSKKTFPPLACYNFDAHEWILIFFGRNITDKIGNQKTLYYATSNNLCFCTTWQNGETRKSHISLNWIVLHTQWICALEKKCHLWCVW